jgi:ABC-type multidrug transport system permease subunit
MRQYVCIRTVSSAGQAQFSKGQIVYIQVLENDKKFRIFNNLTDLKYFTMGYNWLYYHFKPNFVFGR